MEEEDQQNKIDEVKIITLGDTQVGKTSFIIKFIENRFSTNYLSTIGLDFKQKKITLPNKKEIKIRIYDTAGQDRYKTITVNYIKKANGILLIYDITNMDSFISVSRWIEDIKNKGKSTDKISIVLVGNKSDLNHKRVVSLKEGQLKAEEFGLHFYEASCKNGINVEEAFIDLTQQIIAKTKKNGNHDVDENALELNKNLHKDEKQKGCC